MGDKLDVLHDFILNSKRHAGDYAEIKIAFPIDLALQLVTIAKRARDLSVQMSVDDYKIATKRTLLNNSFREFEQSKVKIEVTK